MRSFDSVTFRLQENAIREDLEQQILTDPEAIEVLIRHLAGTQIELTFNEIDYYIWQSQVELLQHLNSSPGCLAEELKIFYHSAASRSPNPIEFMGNKTFEQYLQFLTSHELVTELSGSYHISPRGRDFLVFLTAKGTPPKIL